MNTSAENTEEIYSWNIEKLWNATQLVTEDQPEYKQTIEQIENGILIKYPIQYIINNWYETFEERNTTRIKGYNRVPLMLFIKDKEYRENLMRKILIENWDEGTITEPRLKE